MQKIITIDYEVESFIRENIVIFKGTFDKNILQAFYSIMNGEEYDKDDVLDGFTDEQLKDEIKTSLMKLDKEMLIDLYLQKAFEKDVELKTLQNRVNEVNAIFESKMRTLAQKNEQLHESLSNQCHIRAELEGKVFNLKQENKELKKKIKILEKK